MSRFGAVGADPDPSSLIRLLDHAAAAESGMKHWARPQLVGRRCGPSCAQ